MKNSRFFFFFLFLLAGFTATAQITFEPGYIIDNSGKRSDVLIENVQWRNSPETITYKQAEGAALQSATIEDLSAFGINEGVTYKRYSVEIDRSSAVLSNLSSSRRAEFNKETLFLEVL
ncbi:MAG: hypothetical protein WBH03_06745, partial [Cyclobacteriaceae bacterium]